MHVLSEMNEYPTFYSSMCLRTTVYMGCMQHQMYVFLDEHRKTEGKAFESSQG